MDAEHLLGIRPMVQRTEAGARRQALEFGDGIFAGILGMDALAGAEADGATGDGDDLVGEALDVDLDASRLRVVERCMLESVEVEIGIELAIDALQQVEVEGRGDALLVVIGGV